MIKVQDRKLNTGECLNELRSGLTVLIVLKDNSVCKMVRIDSNENNPVFEILITKPNTQVTSASKLVFLYKKLLNLKEFEMFFLNNYQTVFRLS